MDYYKILSVPRDASEDDLKRGYREMALKYHPSRCKEATAAGVFEKVSEAYDVLGQAKLRAIFDRFGSEGLKHGVVDEEGVFRDGYVFHGDTQRTFVEFFGCNNPFAEYFMNDGTPKNVFVAPPVLGKTITHELDLSLEELYEGTTKKIQVERKVLNSDGHTSSTREQTLCINIKPGWKSGTKVTFAKKGDEGPGIIPGDVVFVVREASHPRFRRNNDNLHFKMNLPLVKALTGFTVEVQTLDDRKLSIAVSDVVHPTYTKRVKGEGMPNGNGFGDLVLEFNVIYPRSLNEDQKALIRAALE